MNKKITLAVIVVLIIGGIYYLESTKIKIPAQNINPEKAQGVESNNEQHQKAPELVGISGYLNTEEGLTISELNNQGKIVLIDFWTYTCINCIRTLPYLTSWDEKYRDEGLVIIGVHTPEFEFEKKYENVQAAIEKYNIKYAVVQDNDYATWTAFKNRYWPRKYLIDTQGNIRYDHIGEGAYEETENKIKELLNEIGKDVSGIETLQENSQGFALIKTSELYAGYSFALKRGQNIGNLQGLQPGSTIYYTIPNLIFDDVIYLEGKWKSNPDDLQLTEENGLIILKFIGNSVNIVAENLENPVIVEVFIDGNYLSKNQAGNDIRFEGDKSFINVDKPQLYNIVNGNYGRYELKLKITSSEFTFNAFTFG